VNRPRNLAGPHPVRRFGRQFAAAVVLGFPLGMLVSGGTLAVWQFVAISAVIVALLAARTVRVALAR
jgi:hypothetical protein